jgi:hypothetical protein
MASQRYVYVGGTHDGEVFVSEAEPISDITDGTTREVYRVAEPDAEVLDTAAGPAIVLRLVLRERE